jgi:hypothetical protein
VGLSIEYWVAPYPLSPPDTPAYYAQLATDPDQRAVLNLPMNYDRPGYLLYQTVHGKPLTVAYISRDDPRTLTERIPVLQHFRHLGPDIIAGDPAAVASAVLSDLDVGTVVLDRYKMPGGQERAYTEQLAAQIFAGQTPIYNDERLTVYRVGNTTEPVPYLQLGPINWGPYQNAEGTPARLLAGGPAAIDIMHAEKLPQNAHLRIRYTSPDGVSVQMLAADGTTQLAVLGPAPRGAVATIPLSKLLTAKAGSLPAVVLVPQAPNRVEINEVALE